jgi:elongation factor G
MSEANPQTRPVMSVGISPRTNGDRRSLQQALSVLAQQDPTITIKTDSLDGQTIVSGTGELHLEAICARISHDFSIQIDVGQFQVIYLETIRKRGEAEGRYIRQTGGHGNYGHVKIRLEPNKTGEGFDFINDLKSGVIPNEYIHPIEQGIRDALQGGVLAGYEVVDVKATLLGGSYHAVDSNEVAFKIAGAIAFKDAARKAKPVLLEPVMSIEIRGQETHLNIGALIGDLKSRRGRIAGLEHYDNSLLLRAIVPMAEMLGYASYIRASSRGNAECSMQLIRYAQVLPDSGSGDDEAGDIPIKPTGPKPESGGDEAGVLAIKPRGPKPKSRFAAVKLDTE